MWTQVWVFISFLLKSTINSFVFIHATLKVGLGSKRCGGWPCSKLNFLINMCFLQHSHSCLLFSTHIKTISHTVNITLFFLSTWTAHSSSDCSIFVYMHVQVCVHLWVWMRLCEGASEERGSCGMKLKAFAQCSSAEHPPRKNGRTRALKWVELSWNNERKTGRWTLRRRHIPQGESWL